MNVNTQNRVYSLILKQEKNRCLSVKGIDLEKYVSCVDFLTSTLMIERKFENNEVFATVKA